MFGTVKKILIIEDKADFREPLVEECRRQGVEVLEADSIESARALFIEHQSTIDAIIVDGCVDSRDTFDTPLLVREMREKDFKKRIVASSHSENNNEILKSAGADFGITKDNQYGILLVLGLEPTY